METTDLIKLDLKELSYDETQNVRGGESAWYWVAYGIGSIGRGIAYVWDQCSDPEMASQMITA